MQANVPTITIENPISLVAKVISEVMERCHYLGLKVQTFNGHVHFIFFMKKARLKLKRMLRELFKKYITNNSNQYGLKATIPRSDETFLHVKVLL